MGITSTSGQSIKVRRNITKDKLTIFRQTIQRSPVPNNNFLLQWMHRAFGKTCTECKRESVSIREIGVQASYETTSVGSQTEYQLMDTRGNKNLSYGSIMAEYVRLAITFSISKSIKG